MPSRIRRFVSPLLVVAAMAGGSYLATSTLYHFHDTTAVAADAGGKAEPTKTPQPELVAPRQRYVRRLPRRAQRRQRRRRQHQHQQKDHPRAAAAFTWISPKSSAICSPISPTCPTRPATAARCTAPAPA